MTHTGSHALKVFLGILLKMEPNFTKWTSGCINENFKTRDRGYEIIRNVFTEVIIRWEETQTIWLLLVNRCSRPLLVISKNAGLRHFSFGFSSMSQWFARWFGGLFWKRNKLLWLNVKKTCRKSDFMSRKDKRSQTQNKEQETVKRRRSEDRRNYPSVQRCYHWLSICNWWFIDPSSTKLFVVQNTDGGREREREKRMKRDWWWKRKTRAGAKRKRWSVNKDGGRERRRRERVEQRTEKCKGDGGKDGCPGWKGRCQRARDESDGGRAISILSCDVISDISITGRRVVGMYLHIFSVFFGRCSKNERKCHKVNGEWC